jgi:RNA polymerase sigma-70 factor (ECF subfamily)
MPASPGEVTVLLKRMQRGDAEAADKLIPLMIDELRRLARAYMRKERIGHTLQPTALINEAYLRLAGYEHMDWKSRSHFIATAAAIMRQILVDFARRRRSLKRGAAEIVPLNENLLSNEQSREIVDLDHALKSLAKLNERQARIVELRYFGGLSVEETAEVLGISPITVKRDWALARAWLRSQLSSK